MNGRRIAIFSQGSRGDVQPYAALAVALAVRGHHVSLAAPDDFKNWIEDLGIAYAPMGTNMQDLLGSPEIRKILGGNPMGIRKVWRTIAVPMLEASLKTVWEVGQGADILIHHPKVVGVADVAEVTGAPVVLASPVPMMPTNEFPIITLACDLGGLLNRATWLPMRWIRRFYGRQLGNWRETELGLPRRYKPRPGTDPYYGAELRLVGVSKHVLPRPRDWDSNTHLTGYWTLPTNANWRPDTSLCDFLRAGPPPVYIGFGSMPVDNQKRATLAIVAAVEEAGLRAVLAAGWSGIGQKDLPESALTIKGAPHDWLFPRMRAVVHHGGAGTTAAGLIAGKPTLICPAGVDQPFWAGRVQALGCGPSPLPLKKLTKDALSQQLKSLTRTPAYEVRAKAVAKALTEEDGVARAVELIEAQM